MVYVICSDDPTYLRQFPLQGVAVNLLGKDGQLAGNLAYVGEVAATFAKEEDEALTLLPGGLDYWQDGSVVGLRSAHHEIAYVWQTKELLEGYFTRLRGGVSRLRPGVPIHVLRGDQAATNASESKGVYQFPMEAEETVLLRAIEPEE